MTLNETEALTILAATPGLGPIKTKLLLQLFGSAVNVLETSIEDIKVFPGLHVKTIQKWGWWKEEFSWKKNLELAYDQGVKLIPYTSVDYPQKLLKIPDYPLILYVKGKLQAIDTQSIAVVGTRNPSIYGKESSEKISEDLARAGFTIVSGLARGIDTSAHEGALRYGRTIAVIGSGLANIYPRENLELANKIIQNGAVISEFPMLTPPDRQNFPRRNRIVSGMTLGTLLIEAPKKSGAMITMEKALQQERKLYALPGRADQENFKGNHYLIKTGRATLIENACDIVQSFDNLFNLNNIETKNHLPQIPLDKEEIALLKQMPQEELGIEEIIKLTKLPVMKLNILLMSLVMKKVIKEYPGKIYKRG